MVTYRLHGERVRVLLDEHNMSVTDGAKKLGVSRSYFSSLLAGARPLSPSVRRRLRARLPFKLVEPIWTVEVASPP